jgi:hypothetical protein
MLLKNRLVRIFMLICLCLGAASISYASMKRMVLQGFLKNGTTVLSGNYKMKFLIKRNGTPVYSSCPISLLPVVNGAFNFQLDDANPSNCGDAAGTNTLFSQMALVNYAADQFNVDVAVDVNNDNFVTQALFSGINLVSVPFALTCQQADTANTANSALTAVTATTATSATTATTATSATSATTAITAGNVSGIVAIANGGTGSSSASAALANLGGAASGANNDITSLSGLSTPLSPAQGGTGIATSATFPASGTIATIPSSGFVTSNGLTLASIGSIDLASSVGTSVLATSNGGTGIISTATYPATGTIATVPAAGLVKSNGTTLINSAGIDLDADTSAVTALPLTKGGTGATSGPAALTNLGAAGANLNNDIVSLSAITTISAPIASTLTLASGLNTIDVSSSKITNLADPTNDQDAATKLYVDTAMPLFLRRYIAQPGATTFTNSGFAGNPTATGTAANTDTNTEVRVRYTTGVTGNNCGGIVGSLVGRIGQNLDVQTRITTDAAVGTNARTVFGLSQSGSTAPATGCTAGPAGMDSPNTTSAAYFRFSAGASDTEWMCMTCNATSCTAAASGVSVANSTPYVMRITASATTINFFIDGAMVCSTSATIPAAATNLLTMTAVNATSTTAKQIFINYVRANSY